MKQHSGRMKPDDVTKETSATGYYNSMSSCPVSNLYNDTENLWKMQRPRDSLRAIALTALFNLTPILIFNII
jgi:hypothetical protein